MGYASRRGIDKERRKHAHNAWSTAFHRFLESLGSDRPIEGERSYQEMRDAFKAGWTARGSRS